MENGGGALIVEPYDPELQVVLMNVHTENLTFGISLVQLSKKSIDQQTERTRGAEILGRLTHFTETGGVAS